MNDFRPQLAPEVQALLDALRMRIRRYVWLEGLATGLAWIGVAFWATLAIDWFFEPSSVIRQGLLIGVGIVLAFVLVQLIGRRAFVRLSNANMAMLLERRFPVLEDGLLTAVALADRAPEPEEYDPAMLRHTCREMADRVAEVELPRIFNPGPLRRSILAAVLLAASVVMFVVLNPSAGGTWARRNLAFSDELWPRRTRLVVDGFDRGPVKVARGADLEVVAKADTSMPWVPKVVEVRYRTEGGSRRRETMNRRGQADPARDAFQQYAYTFRSVFAPIAFDVIGGDDAVRGLQIEVVESPTLASMTLDCRYPGYMARPARTLPVTGVMQLPLGTQISVKAKANKELVRVQVDQVGDQPGAAPRPADVRDIDPDHRGFRYTLPPLAKDTTLLFTLFDSDGIRSREPVRLALVTIADDPPQVAVRLAGIGSAITPQARLPVAGRVSDDYGLARIWFETTVDQQPPAMQAIASPPASATDWPLDTALEAAELKLAPGRKLVLAVKAADRYDLGKAANVGTSEQWQLDVVTPDQLRVMLQSRELVLRQRFEAIIHEVTETRDVLGAIRFTAPAADAKAKKPDAKSGAEPGDESGDGSRRAAWSPAAEGLRVERAIQNGRKNAQEVLGVAEAIDDIRQQLINNRIDTEELRARLGEGIAQPLRHVGDKMFPELETRLNRLQATLADKDAGPRNAEAAQRQVGEILLAMQKVLDRMLELEDFNEVVELLRGIIKQQDQLDDATKQRHKQKIRELLED